MTESLAILYEPATLAWVGILLVLPAAVVLLFWGFWALLMYLLRNAPEAEAPPYEAGRNRDMAFAHRAYRVSFGVFWYASILFAGCLYGVVHWRLLVTSASGAPAFLSPTQSGLPAAMAVLFPASASLAVTSFLTVTTAASYGAALAETAMLRALWLTFAGVGCGVGAGLSAWLYPPASLWVAWAVPGGFLLALGVRELLAHNETGGSTLSVARAKARGVRSDIARELVDRGLVTEGEYRGEPPGVYWARIAAWSLLLPPLFWAAVSLFLGAVVGPVKAGPSSSDLLSFGFFLGCVFGGFAFLRGMRWARSVKWDEAGASVSLYWGHERRFRWDEVVAVYVGGGTVALLARTKTGAKFAILPGRPGCAQLHDVLVAHAYSRKD